TRKRRGGLRDVETRVLQRATEHSGTLPGRGEDPGRGAGTWPGAPARGAPIYTHPASAQPVRTSSAPRWSKRRQLDSLPNCTAARRCEPTMKSEYTLGVLIVNRGLSRRRR